MLLLGRLFLARLFKKTREQFGNQNANRDAGKKRREGETFVQFKPDEKKHIPGDEGDYVDYEELK